MRFTRRSWLAAAGLLPLQASLAAAAPTASSAGVSAAGDDLTLPAKAQFPTLAGTYLDSGTMHPFSLGARRALDAYQASRALDPSVAHIGIDDTAERVRGRFAALINATPEEICLVPSTTAGEALVVQALGLPQGGGRIVTDTLHFFGSFYLYEELGKRGMDVVWLKPRDGRRIDPADIEAAIDRNTRLVAISLVSTINGFQHDLKRVCEIAHARGAMVYADIVHAAGSAPIDVRDSGVDFAASAGYKWLMGDFGQGFLYVRADRLERLPRTQFGYYQVAEFKPHVFPLDPPGATVADITPRLDATGHFAMGTTSGGALIQLDHSLDWIQRLGVPAIQAHRQPLLNKARVELERMGYRCMTPEESTSPLLAFVCKDARTALGPRLDRAKVKITLSANRFRISPSVFNDEADIDRLLGAFG